MPIRRCALAVATLVVAVIVALAVPVSQLRTFSLVSTCCCPDPTDCHCPPAPCDDGKHDAMKRCHNTMAAIVAAATPALTPAALVPVASPLRLALVSLAPLAGPHAPPAAARPDAPS